MGTHYSWKPVERISKDRAATRILAVLAEEPGREFRRRDLGKRTALRPHQFRNGARYLKFTLASDLTQVTGWAYVSRYSGVYMLTKDVDELDESQTERMRDAIARAEGLHAYVQQMELRCDDRMQRRALRAARKLVATAVSILSDDER